MILFFPVMYPDELFFSAVSRFFERIGNQDDPIFDGLNFSIFFKNTYPPKDLEEFSSHIPSEDNFDPMNVLYNHTIFPFWAPFKSTKTRSEFLMKPREPGKGRQVFFLNNIQFCPECYKEDIEKYSEPYWHCNHNILGVTICVKHRVFLETIDLKNTPRKFKAYAARSLRTIPPSKPIDPTNYEHILLERISIEFQWIWDNREKILASNYNISNLHSGWITSYIYKNFINARDFSSQIEDFYTPQILKRFSCAIYPDQRYPWTLRVLYNPHEN
jgi:hypothetical protein